MRLIRDLDELPEGFRHAAVSIGVFDGVHWGHARIVERLSALSRKRGSAAVVFTFDPHPVRVLQPQQAPMPLSWAERKAELLADLGADAVVAYPTDEALLRLNAKDFFQQIIRGRLAAEALVEGPNFFFGRDRSGDVDALRRLCEDAGVTLEVVEPVRIEGQTVSSSRIRGLIAAGHVEQAGRLLTQPYRIRGTVVRGAGRGATLGYPTANVAGVDTLLPGQGIYAGRAWLEGSQWPAAINIGPNPTFGEASLKVELHLIGYEGSLYGRHVEVDILARLREIQRFASVDRLVRQVDEDVAAAGRIVRQHDSRGD